MRFRLTYSGPLVAADSPQRVDNKYDIRRAFHAQIMQLTRTHPAFHGDRNFFTSGDMPAYPTTVGNFKFVPLIHKEQWMTCRLDILMLRNGPPGELVLPNGDIDNRVKTLFDALRVPTTTKELPALASPSAGDDPYFLCLLANDDLITGISIDTDRLLASVYEESKRDHVSLTIDVSVRISKFSSSNLAFLGD